MLDYGENIHPEFTRQLSRTERESLLKQRAGVIWLYGLSGSGKSTLVNALDRRLYREGFLSVILDGDNLRSGLNNNLGFSDQDRHENIRELLKPPSYSLTTASSSWPLLSPRGDPYGTLLGKSSAGRTYSKSIYNVPWHAAPNATSKASTAKPKRESWPNSLVVMLFLKNPQLPT